MDDKSLEVLEFPRITEIVAGFTTFSASRALALQIQPLSDYERIHLLLSQSAEARRLLSMEPGFSIGTVFDIREAVALAARGKILEPLTLIEIRQTVAAMRQLRSTLVNLSGELPLLWNIAEGLAEMRPLEKDIATCIAPTGELLDSASPTLAAVRQQLKELRQQLLQSLQAIISSPKRRRIIQEPIITQREGRYVIPIKVEFRREMKGIVHSVSNTGDTIFVEPWAVVEQGNALRELVMEEAREIERILKSLSAKVGTHEAELCHSVALAAELDLALAKGRYAISCGAGEPSLSIFNEGGNLFADEQPGIIRLVQARHPLLVGRAVPLDVEIGRDFSILVITGPNTGGKTVALKTIGLLSLMTQAGIPIPAADKSHVTIFDGIFADIGDEQSIEQTLSSFSWHMGNIIRIINEATEKSLVLLDELGMNTDPAEGSALARSVLLYFLSKGTLTVATTHFSELKAFAHATPGLQNASFDFAPVTLAPTYHLTMGIPGGSNALATASRLGLPTKIIDDARGMLSKGAQDMETMIADLVAAKHAIEATRRDLDRRSIELEQHKMELEARLGFLETEERKVIQETRDKLTREAAELHKEIRRATSELSKKKSKEGIEQARRLLSTVSEQLRSETWQPKMGGKGEQELIDESSICVGDTVRLKEVDLQATVLWVSYETLEIEVQSGLTKLKLGLDSVEKVALPQGKTTARFIPVRRHLRAEPVRTELDLRGKRAEEIEWLLDSYLNNASLANLGEVRIIHGFGTGTVRNIVRGLLTSHPLSKAFRPGQDREGGDGVTIVKL